jgi:hypothetical protein
MMIGYIAHSSLFLFSKLSNKLKYFHVPVLILILSVFVVADMEIKGHNECERAALQALAQSEEKIIQLDNACPVMAWEIITNYKESKTNTDMLRFWNVIDEEKYYYQAAKGQ